MKTSFAALLILPVTASSSCDQSPAHCEAAEPSRTTMVERAAEEVVARMKRRNEPNGFSGASIKPGCCYITKRRPTWSDRSTYRVEIDWEDRKRGVSHSFERALDECGRIIDERGY